jgi:hypothetical protein
MLNLPTAKKEFLIQQTKLIISNYRRWTGKDLCAGAGAGAAEDEKLVDNLFFAPRVVVSAGNETDPILNYGNQAALHLWEMNWETLTKTPGRHTAEALEREKRESFLETVRKQGYIDNYQGVRITSTGKRFEIQKATVWNLIDEKGEHAGQAATFELPVRWLS